MRDYSSDDLHTEHIDENRRSVTHFLTQVYAQWDKIILEITYFCLYITEHLFSSFYNACTKLKSKHLWLDMWTNLHIRLSLSLEYWKINKYYVIFKIPTSRFDKYQMDVCHTLDSSFKKIFNIYVQACNGKFTLYIFLNLVKSLEHNNQNATL